MRSIANKTHYRHGAMPTLAEYFKIRELAADYMAQFRAESVADDLHWPDLLDMCHALCHAGTAVLHPSWRRHPLPPTRDKTPLPLP